MNNTIFSDPNGITNLEVISEMMTKYIVTTKEEELTIPLFREFDLEHVFGTGQGNTFVVSTEVGSVVMKYTTIKEAREVATTQYIITNPKYILKYYGLYKRVDDLLMVLEYYPHPTIEDIDLKGSYEDVKHILREIISSLIIFRHTGLYHDDLMSENVLSDGRSIKLIDYAGNSLVNIIRQRKLHILLSTTEEVGRLYTDTPIDDLIELVSVRACGDIALTLLKMENRTGEHGCCTKQIMSIKDNSLRRFIKTSMSEDTDLVPNYLQVLEILK